MTTLNPTLNPINPQERVKINENWDRIMQRFSSLQNQISILSGETSVEDILNELNTAISNANSTVQGLVDNTNHSIANVNQKITEVDGKLVELQTAIDNADLATQATNSAITDAREAIADINAYFANFRFVGEYNATTTYRNFNFVRYQKSTFVSLKENLGITPNDDGINWRLVAAGGIDGMGAVVSVNGKNPDSNGDVTLEPIDIGSASSEQINETNNNLSTLQQQFTTHVDQTARHINRDDDPLSTKYEFVDGVSIGLVSADKGFPESGNHHTVKVSANFITQTVIGRYTGKHYTRGYNISTSQWTKFKEYVSFDDLGQTATLSMSAATQTIANDTAVTVKFEVIDNANAPWVTLNADGTFSLQKGKYVIDTSVRFATSSPATGYRQIASGSFASRVAPVAQGETIVLLPRFIDATVDDTTTGISVRHTQGAALDILRANTNSVIRKVG